MATDKAPSLATIERRGAKAVEQKAKALQSLVVEYVDTDSVKPNSYNPNRQNESDFSLLLRSMREDGFTQPIVVQKSTREIVDGEHRWRAARELGLTQVPVVMVEMSDEQMRISTLRHNRARGSEDVGLSSQLLRDLRELGALDWAKDSLMLNDKELQKLIDDVPAPEDLAGAEFTEAWALSANDPEAAERRTGAGDRVDFTAEAEKNTAAYEKRLLAAQSHADRKAVELEMRKNSFRLFITFSPEDAAVVRSVLEPTPAKAVVELCRPIYQAMLEDAADEAAAAEEAKVAAKAAPKAKKAAKKRSKKVA